jgi:hypothetical protein
MHLMAGAFSKAEASGCDPGSRRYSWDSREGARTISAMVHLLRDRNRGAQVQQCGSKGALYVV